MGNRYVDYALYFAYSLLIIGLLTYRNEVDVVHTFPGPISHIGIIGKQILGLEWVADILDDPSVELEALENKKPYLKFVAYTVHICAMKRTLRFASRVYIVGVSRDRGLPDHIITKYSVPKDVVCATPNGVDVSRTSRDCEQANDTFRLFYVGSMQSIRGLDTLLEAVGEIYKEIPELRVQLLGPVRRRQDYENIRDKLREHSIEDIVEFSGERVDHGYALDQMCQADICVLPLSDRIDNFRYTYPIKLFEYLAMGQPIVATRLPGIAEVVEDEKHGLLVEPDESEAFADAIQRIYTDDTLRENLSENARDRANDFDWETIHEQVLEAYPQD
ncbi:glycosyltransferase family 4 protein [Halorubrum ezzemoulense]|uniref:glycosyltransferase family 4 protein n=1 Tax=Halorubrum ezzemoulense TaxID=337243 RepID=UPI00233129DF|nr:glycosyltransferase family 4 protein [Halorubrum ezzemoulense]MDB9300323.1 glycosyltransferase family 4 protein [Halorubrum ezzemoulense]